MTTYQIAYILDIHKKCIQQQQIQNCKGYCRGCCWDVNHQQLIEALDNAIGNSLQGGLVNYSGGLPCT